MTEAEELELLELEQEEAGNKTEASFGQKAAGVLGKLASLLSSETYMEAVGVPEGPKTKLPVDLTMDWKRFGKYTPVAKEGEEQVGTPTEISARNAAGFAVDMLGPALLSKGLKGLARPLEALANKATLAHLRPTPKVATAIGKEGLANIAKEVRASGAMKFGRKAETTAANLEPIIEQTGRLKGKITAASPNKIDPVAMANKFDKEVIEPLRGNSELLDEVAMLEKKKSDFLNTYAKDFGPNELGATRVEDLKTAAQGKINYMNDPTTMQQAKMDAAKFYKETGEGLVTDPNFIPVKQKYGNLKAAQGMVDRTANLTDGGLMSRLTDLGVSGPALKGLIEGNIAGVPLVAARGLTKGRVASSLGTSLGGLSNIVKATPEISAATSGKIAVPFSAWLQLMKEGQNQ